MIPFVIAANTYREATRDRVLAGMGLAGLVLLVVAQGLTPLALGEGRRLVMDLGLTAISMLGLLVVLTVGTSLVAKEIERRTIFNLLSRPIARSSYLVGKWAGLVGAVWTIAAALALAQAGLLALRGQGAWTGALFQATYLTALELSIVTALAVMFSALSTPALSALYTIGCYLVGQWSYDLRAFAAQFPPGLAEAIGLFANLVPNLPLFNMRALASEGALTTSLHLGMATGYAALYCACVLALAAAAFESRDFK